MANKLLVPMLAVCVVLLVVVAVLQIAVLVRVEGLKPKAVGELAEEAPPVGSVEQIDALLAKRVPTLEEIDQKIRQWTMHYGQHFSDSGRIGRLESAVKKRLDQIDKKLDQLAATQ